MAISTPGPSREWPGLYQVPSFTFMTPEASNLPSQLRSLKLREMKSPVLGAHVTGRARCKERIRRLHAFPVPLVCVFLIQMQTADPETTGGGEQKRTTLSQESLWESIRAGHSNHSLSSGMLRERGCLLPLEAAKQASGSPTDGVRQIARPFPLRK